ncbi:hypothetical protein DFH06DRAFT_1144838 [Mycena polygramma]|nr:hypothetical protein DFH06DRAFT_1144838 [Mycena polygramma]
MAEGLIEDSWAEKSTEKRLARGWLAPCGKTYDGLAVARIKVGRTAQMQLRRKTAAGLFAKASDEEKASVEEEWLRQERPSKAAVMKASTPEEYQNGLDKIGPWLKTFHGVVGDALGWVGATVLTGPIPNQGGKIGTQSYCHGVTPAGHTIDQALPGWHEHVITPVQQFGKKVFDHDARRARAMKPADAAESHHDPVEPVTSAGQEPRRRKRRAKAKESAVDEADPFPPPSSAFTNIPVSSFNDVPSPPPSPPPASSFTDVPGGLDYSALQPFADFGDLNLNIDIDPETMRALEESSQEFMWETRALEGVDGLGAPAASTSEHESSAMASPTVHAATPATRPTPRATYRGSSFATTTPTQQSDSTATSTQHDDGDNPLERFEVTPLSSESSANQGLATYVADFVFDPRPSTSSAGFPRPGMAGAPPSDTPSMQPTSSATGSTTSSAPLTVSPRPPPTRATASVPSPQASVRDSTAAASPSTTPSRNTSTTTLTTPPARSTASLPPPSPPAAPSPSPQAPVGSTPLRLASGGRPFLSATVTTPSPLRAVHTPPATVRPMSALAIGRTPEASGSGDAGVTTTASALTADDFPQSRPMCNAPPAVGRGGMRGGRGAGGRGASTRGRGASRGAARGRGGRTGRSGGSAAVGEGSGGEFLQTYDDDGSTIPLPLGTPVETVSLARTQEIRNAAKERDSAKARAARARDHGVHVFPPPPPGHEALRAEPAALGGRPAAAPAVPSVPPPLTPRKRRAPTNLGKAYIPQKKRTLAEIRSEAEQKKQMAEAATGMKRKADENGKTRTTKKMKGRARLLNQALGTMLLNQHEERGSLGEASKSESVAARGGWGSGEASGSESESDVADDTDVAAHGDVAARGGWGSDGASDSESESESDVADVTDVAARRDVSDSESDSESDVADVTAVAACGGWGADEESESDVEDVAARGDSGASDWESTSTSDVAARGDEVSDSESQSELADLAARGESGSDSDSDLGVAGRGESRSDWDSDSDVAERGDSGASDWESKSDVAARGDEVSDSDSKIGRSSP